MMATYAGSGWVKSALKLEEMSELGCEVADVLGDVFLGIYHLNTTSLRKVDWSNPRWIEVTLGKELATFDTSELTRLVVLCHDRKLRCSIKGIAPRMMRLQFSARSTRDGDVWARHPSIEAAIESIRSVYGEPTP